MIGSVQDRPDHHRVRRPLRFRLAVLLSLLSVFGAVALAGCADRAPGGESTPDGSRDAGFPVTINSPGSGESFTLRSKPTRIVSLSPPATETLYAIGAGTQVVAVDAESNYPKEAPTTELSGLSPNPEAIAEYNPQLVVAHADADGLVAALDKLDIPTLILPAAQTLEAAYRQYTVLGKATGHRAAAEDLASRTRDEIDKIIADTPKPDTPLSYYHELGPDYYTATSDTFIGGVYRRFGLRNIADGSDDPAAGGYPQLSAQRVLRADPDLIFLADTKCCAMTPDKAGARPGWDELTAVRSGLVVPLNDDTASRWSPRVVEFVRTVADAVTSASKRG
ncbi:MAG: ABC transporter substrate-binding protein [Pseudonocardiaceae bacterium]|nr:ABC transporter substrate-binding protein [Pseudonocardiaceae bacterium]